MKLPVIPPQQTTNLNQKYPDFILLAEFCEQRGPVTLLTVPEKRTQFEHFDFDSFSRRILSSDHTRKVDPGGCNSGWVSPEDTMVYLRDTALKAHAYVHHLTLHDVEARGYVRPLCLCYVTQEESKVMQNFERLMEWFNQISGMMKFGNNCVFLSDIQSRIQHLDQNAFGISEEDYKEVVRELDQFKNDFLRMVQKHPSASSLVHGLFDSAFQLDEDLLSAFVVNSISNSQQQTLPKDFVRLLQEGLSASPLILKKYMPTILKQIHKSSGFEKALRLFPDIVVPLYDTIIDMSRHCLYHFSRPNHILERELDDIGENDSSNIQDLLFIGGIYVMDFSLKASGRLSTSAGSSSYSSSLSRSYSPPSTNAELSTSYSHSRTPPTTEYVSDSSLDDTQFFTPDNYFSSDSMTPSTPPLLMNYRGNGSYVSQIFTGTQSIPANVLNPKLQRMSIPLDKDAAFSRGKSLLTEMIRPSSPSGTSVLQLLEHYSFAKDVVYSILIGVPVIIFGKQDNELPVRNFVNTLKLFIPGLLPNDTCSVAHWKTTPITALDLSKLKLIGMSKKVVLSKSVEQFISRLDLEEQTFLGPAYKGDILDKIFSLTKQWPDERTLVSYIHAQFLDWGSKAALHYHLDSIASIRLYFSPRVVSSSKSAPQEVHTPSALSRFSQVLSGSQRSRKKKDSFGTPSMLSIPKTPPQRAHYLPVSATSLNMHDLERITDYSKSILSGMGITKRSDIAIIEYLGEIVKQQQRNSFEAAADISPKCSLRLATHEKIKVTNTFQRRSRRVSTGRRSGS